MKRRRAKSPPPKKTIRRVFSGKNQFVSPPLCATLLLAVNEGGEDAVILDQGCQYDSSENEVIL